jgi:hypothetical protein
MQGSMAGSAPIPAVVRAASLACRDVGKAQEFAPLRKSSGDFRAITRASEPAIRFKCRGHGQEENADEKAV